MQRSCSDSPSLQKPLEIVEHTFCNILHSLQLLCTHHALNASDSCAVGVLPSHITAQYTHAADEKPPAFGIDLQQHCSSRPASWAMHRHPPQGHRTLAATKRCKRGTSWLYQAVRTSDSHSPTKQLNMMATKHLWRYLILDFPPNWCMNPPIPHPWCPCKV